MMNKLMAVLMAVAAVPAPGIAGGDALAALMRQAPAAERSIVKAELPEALPLPVPERAPSASSSKQAEAILKQAGNHDNTAYHMVEDLFYNSAALAVKEDLAGVHAGRLFHLNAPPMGVALIGKETAAHDDYGPLLSPYPPFKVKILSSSRPAIFDNGLRNADAYYVGILEEDLTVFFPAAKATSDVSRLEFRKTEDYVIMRSVIVNSSLPAEYSYFFKDISGN